MNGMGALAFKHIINKQFYKIVSLWIKVMQDVPYAADKHTF